MLCKLLAHISLEGRKGALDTFLAVPPTKAELVGYEVDEELVVREEEEVELVCR